MALLDVNEVFDDALLTDTFSVIRRVNVTNALGRAVVTPTTIADLVGTAVPGEAMLDRRSDMDVAPGSLTIYSAFRFRTVSKAAGGSEYLPDLVSWNGRYYICTAVESYANFGAGFVQATFELYDYQPTPEPGGPP